MEPSRSKTVTYHVRVVCAVLNPCIPAMIGWEAWNFKTLNKRESSIYITGFPAGLLVNFLRWTRKWSQLSCWVTNCVSPQMVSANMVTKHGGALQSDCQQLLSVNIHCRLTRNAWNKRNQQESIVRETDRRSSTESHITFYPWNRNNKLAWFS